MLEINYGLGTDVENVFYRNNYGFDTGRQCLLVLGGEDRFYKLAG